MLHPQKPILEICAISSRSVILCYLILNSPFPADIKGNLYIHNTTMFSQCQSQIRQDILKTEDASMRNTY